MFSETRLPRWLAPNLSYKLGGRVPHSTPQNQIRPGSEIPHIFLHTHATVRQTQQYQVNWVSDIDRKRWTPFTSGGERYRPQKVNFLSPGVGGFASPQSCSIGPHTLFDDADRKTYVVASRTIMSQMHNVAQQPPVCRHSYSRSCPRDRLPDWDFGAKTFLSAIDEQRKTFIISGVSIMTVSIHVHSPSIHR
jgi:hypothetical protein